MNYITEEQFDTAMQEPRIAAEIIRMLAEDMAVAIAIVSGPEATQAIHNALIRRIAGDLLIGSGLAHRRLTDHLEGGNKMHGKIVLPH